MIKSCGSTTIMRLIIGLVTSVMYTAVSAPLACAQLVPHPELALQVGHTDMIEAVACAHHLTIMASGSDDKTIKVWDMQTGEIIRTLIGHKADVRSVAFSSDDSTIVSGSSDRTVKLWDVQSGKLKRTITGHFDAIESVAFSSDDKTIVSGSLDRMVKLWDVQTGKLKRSFTGHTRGVWAVAFSPDNQTIASGGDDLAVKLWDAKTGRLRTSLVGHTDMVGALAFSSDGHLVASGSDDQSIKVWETRTGRLQYTIRGQGEKVRSLAFSIDGSTLASGCWDGSIKLWDPRNGRLQRALSHRSKDLINAVESVAFSYPTNTIVSGAADRTIDIWNYKSGALRRRLTGQNNTIAALAYSAADRLIATANSDDTVKLWDARTGELKRTLTGHHDAVNAVVFSADGERLASSDGTTTTTGEIIIWDPKTGASVQHLDGHPDGGINALAYSSDSSLLASAGQDHTIRLWDGKTGALRRTLVGHSDQVTSVAFSPDNSTLCSGSKDDTLRLWDLQSEEPRQVLQVGSQGVNVACYSPDGQIVASTGNSKSIKLWDAKSGRLMRTLVGTEESVDALAFAPSGRTLATGGTDNIIRVWDTQTGVLQHTLSGHSERINALAFLPNGETLLSGSADNTVGVWHVPNGKLQASLLSIPAQALFQPPSTKPIGAVSKPIPAVSKDLSTIDEYVVFTPEGYYTGSPTADRYVRFRMVNLLFPAESFQVPYRRPDLVQAAMDGANLEHPHRFDGPVPPQVRISQPRNGERISGKWLTLHLEASDDSGVRGIDIRINGSRVDAKLVPVYSGATNQKPLSAISKEVRLTVTHAGTSIRKRYGFTTEIPLPASQEVRIEAVAFDNDNLQSSRETVVVTHTAMPEAGGRLMGVCVGVSKYQDASLNLRYADQDATALAAALNKQVELYTDAQVISLTDQQATAPRILAALDQLLDRVTPRDTVMVLLSGHGWRSDDQHFYFATYNVDRNHIADTAMQWQTVVDRLKRLSARSRRVVVFLDACHSGSAGTNEDLVKALLSANAGVIVFASSKGSEVSVEDSQLGHGVFTEAVLEAVQGRAARPQEKTVTILDFLAYISYRVKTLTDNQQHPQVPFLEDFNTADTIVSAP